MKIVNEVGELGIKAGDVLTLSPEYVSSSSNRNKNNHQDHPSSFALFPQPSRIGTINQALSMGVVARETGSGS